MNTEGCPQGRFTDQILMYYSIPGSCEASVVTWFVIMSLLLTVRCVILMLVWHSWYSHRAIILAAMGRGATNVSSQDRRKATRVPLVQMIGTVDTITMISLFVLASLNIVSADNGTTLLMIVAHALLPVSALQFFALKKMVGLGHRILRFKLIGVKEDVSTFDMILRAVLRLIAFLIAFSFCFLIASVSHGKEFVFSRVSLVALTIEQFLMHFATVYQYHRVIRCLRDASSAISSDRQDPLSRTTSDDTTENLTNQSKASTTYAGAIRRLRYQQLTMSLNGMVACLILIYFAITLQSPWGWLAGLVGLHCVVNFAMLAAMVKPRRRRGEENKKRVNDGGAPTIRTSRDNTENPATLRATTMAASSALVTSSVADCVPVSIEENSK